MRVTVRVAVLALVALSYAAPVGARAGTDHPQVPVGARGHAAARPVNVGATAAAPALRTAGLNLDGLGQEGTGPEPADASAAPGPRYVLEAVNSRVAAYTRAGTVRCSLALAALLGVVDGGPRVLYDAAADRYALVASTPAAPGGPALLRLAVTRGGDPCAGWWSYAVSFTGTVFPFGTRLDRPYLAQDPQALLLSANGYAGSAYLGSIAFALPKAAFYAGVAVAVPAFPVAYSTAPVNATDDGDDWYLAAVPGVGYHLYQMVNSAGPGTLLLDGGTVAAPFQPPSRWARQCGGAGLDPLDGRIPSPPVRVGDYVWFAHGIDVGGRPGVRYGALDVFAGTVAVATAARSATSDDLNPSIAATDAGYGLDYVWLTWAATDPGAQPCQDVAAVVDGVPPGDGVPDRRGTAIVVAAGGGTATAAPFGRYSSIAADPVTRPGCPPGTAAVAAQQYFGPDGRWRTRLTRVEWC
jgi:hypothetical protein